MFPSGSYGHFYSGPGIYFAIEHFRMDFFLNPEIYKQFTLYQIDFENLLQHKLTFILTCEMLLGEWGLE